MIRLLIFTFLFIFGQNQILAQCSNVSIQIPSYGEDYIQLDNPAEFFMPPVADLSYLYEISTTSNSTIITSSTEERWILDLPTNGLSINDAVIVDLQVTSPTEVCTVRDTMEWVVLFVILDTEIFGWESVSGGLNSGVLPIELVEFKGELKGDKVLLDWTTASEENNKGFEIQKSKDGRSWENLGFVESQGNSFRSAHYDFADHHLAHGSNYYRLKQIDFSGEFSYSKVIVFEVNHPKANHLTLYIYPNPSPNEVTISVEGITIPTEQVEVFNAQGQLVLNVPIQKNQKSYKINSLADGMYLVRLTAGGQRITKRMMIQK